MSNHHLLDHRVDILLNLFMFPQIRSINLCPDNLAAFLSVGEGAEAGGLHLLLIHLQISILAVEDGGHVLIHLPISILASEDSGHVAVAVRGRLGKDRRWWYSLRSGLSWDGWGMVDGWRRNDGGLSPGHSVMTP
jgi:hypothetical protein